MELISCEHLGGGYGNAGMRPERHLSGRNLAGQPAALSRKPGDSGGKAVNPRGMGTASPSKLTSLLFSASGSGQPQKKLSILGIALFLQGADFYD